MNEQVMDIVTEHVRLCAEITKIKTKLKKTHIYKLDKGLIGTNEFIYTINITNDDPFVTRDYNTCYLFNNIFINGYAPIKIDKSYTLANFVTDLTELEKCLDYILNDGHFGLYNIFDDDYNIFITIKNARNYAHKIIQLINDYIKDSSVIEEDE